MWSLPEDTLEAVTVKKKENGEHCSSLGRLQKEDFRKME
jgi:hypothetical protein